ncbi:hypothetical protein SBRCBS47491_009098 [Sporothrix bragantina]|uniref:Uncharacterized protein n=1 Tax=Sporothrix bragantina TaxID=671064 RepID=A0ABP0CRZ6_9PEZI
MAFSHGDCDDCNVHYGLDRYAALFVPTAEELIWQQRRHGQSRELYLRTCTVCHVGRFPIIRSALDRKFWELKAAYLGASPYLNPASTEVNVPFMHTSAAAWESADAMIPLHLCITSGSLSPPPTGSPCGSGGGWPVLLFICSLDHYRIDFEQRTWRYAKAGLACIVAEIPGTGDYPATRDDHTSLDKLYSRKWTGLNIMRTGTGSTRPGLRLWGCARAAITSSGSPTG